MDGILVPLSPGELLDKITILRIKAQRIQDAGKLGNIRRELVVLEQHWSQAVGATIELAGDELEKGLALEPRHPLLRTSAGYQQMRLGNLNAAIEILEGVIRDDDSLRIAVPTLALCYVQAGQRERAAALLKDDTLAAAEADSEMAYRLASYFAVEGDSSEALHWLRRAIYLGNENYPWFQINPAWNNLRTNTDFERLLEDLKRGFRKNQKTWKRLLGQVPPDGE